MIDVIWDMETNDPDDFLTLLLLADHPEVRLKAVTILPGSAAQVGLVRHALREWFGLDIPVGARNLDAEKQAVSPWHYEAYGSISPSRDAEKADELLRRLCSPNVTLITGAALTNLRTAMRNAADIHESFEVGQLVVQGGFAGEGVVPTEHQLAKFRGLTTAPTHNLIGDTKAAHLVLNHPGFGIRYFVSKNVCHRVIYDPVMHQLLEKAKSTKQSLELIWRGMEVYLKTRPEGKMLHDPLTACCAIDPGIGTWAEVELFQEGNTWGAHPSPGSKTWIITNYDHEKFLGVFMQP